MTKVKDGGPAFPQSSDHPYADKGMSLRDWFAGQALIGLCASPHNMLVDGVHQDFAQHAYKLADAMLTAREVGND